LDIKRTISKLIKLNKIKIIRIIILLRNVKVRGRMVKKFRLKKIKEKRIRKINNVTRNIKIN
jgi:hypothetical protein